MRDAAGRGVRRIGVLVAFLATVAAGCAWPTFAGGPARTGFQPFERELGVEEVSAGLQLDWVARTGTAVASPVTDGRRVFVVDTSGRLSAYDASGRRGCGGEPVTCAPLWTADVGGRVLATPTVAGSTVFVATQYGELYGFDAAGRDGCAGEPIVCQPVWTATAGSPGGLAFVSSPAVVAGRLFVGSPDGNVYAFDATGRIGCTPATGDAGARAVDCAALWTADAGSDVQTSPAVAGGSVYVGTGDGAVVAFDAWGRRGCSGTPRRCEPLWRAPLDAGGIYGSVGVAHGRVFASTYGGLVAAVDARGERRCGGQPVVCRPLWTAATGDSSLSAPAVAYGTVFVAGWSGVMVALDARGEQGCTTEGDATTCAPLWRAPSGALASTFSAPSVADGVVYTSSLRSFAAPTFRGIASAFDARGCGAAWCEPLWSRPLPDIVDAAPAISDGRLYVASLDGTLSVFTR